MTRFTLSALVALSLVATFAADAAADTFKGALSIVWGDPQNPGVPVNAKFILELETRQYIEVLVNAGATSLLPLQGQPVIVTGRLSAPPATIISGASQVILADSIAADPSATPRRSPSIVSGTRKVIYVLTYFTDDAVVPHPGTFYTDLTIPDTSSNALIPSTINGFFKKTSGGLFSWVPTIANGGGWIALPHAKSYYAPCGGDTSCFDNVLYDTDAVTAAQAAGVDFSLYDNVNFVMSNDLDCCAWGGNISVGGKSLGATWEPPWAQSTTTYAHEMGHSLGLVHSGWVYFSYDSPWDTLSDIQGTDARSCGSYLSKNNGGAATPLSCDEPGDGYIMAHRDFLGWVPPINQVTVPINGVTSVGLEGGALPIGSGTKLIKICITGYLCSGTGPTTRYFTVEARVKSLGSTSQFDNAIPSDGVIIHDVYFGRSPISGGCFFNNQSGWAVPVDATPGDYNSTTCTYAAGQALFNAQFTPGMTYTNSTYGFSVKVLNRVGNTFRVNVNGGDGFTSDFDGDARADMTLYQADGTWRILKSSSSYTAATTVSLGGAGYVPVPGDYDGDGKIDPAVYNRSTGQWIALKSSTNYTTTFSQNWGGSGYLPEPGDYDGDGTTDLGLYVPATGQWAILKSSTGYTTTLNVNWGGAGYTPVPGKDFDGDGRSDVVVYSESTGYWYILKSSSGFATPQNINWGGHGYTLVPGDYDADGRADPALYERATGNWYVLLSSTSYSSSLHVSWGGAGYDPVPGDYDGDARFDAAIVQRSTGNWYVLRSSSGYTTSFSVPGWSVSSDMLVSGAIVPSSGGDTRRASDFDGDGKADITVYNATTATWYSLTSTSNYTATQNHGWGGPVYFPVPGDYDGDGKTDYGVYVFSTGTWSILLSGSGYTTTLSKSAGGPAYGPALGDYDGDGKTDLGVYDGSSGNWFVLKSSSNYTTTISINWGGAGYVPVPGDYDGDGKTDLGVYQPGTGTWLVLLSSSNYTTSLSKSVGGPTYAPVQGDYDGDGKTDFVVYNSNTGLWYGLLSSTNYTTTISISWGGPTYSPTKGDYDGDGKTDLAVYEVITGTWYILLSGSNYTTTITKSWGGTGYSPVPSYP